MIDELQELWIEARPEVIEAWTEHLLSALEPVELSIPPRPALIMMEARDSVEGRRFCVGEIMVMECQVVVRKACFWGRVVGNQPIRALALALLGAARNCAPDSLASLCAAFRLEEDYLKESKVKAAKALGATRVVFDTMTPT